jgi:Bacterial Ig domain
MIAVGLRTRLTNTITQRLWLLVAPWAMFLVACAGFTGSASKSGADTTPPTVSITSPASGATVLGTITVTATATDNVAVASVQFQVDGSNLGAAATVAPYAASLNTTTLTNGKHTLTAIATDTANNKATSAAVPITVNNTNSTAPTVSITSPASGATVTGTISVTASASDSSVSITSVQFQVDGANLGAAATVAPYAASLNTTTLTNGKHTLTAIATDTANSKATSAAVSITVNNSTQPLAVTITFPSSGATVSGTISVTANASASAGVASVQFLLDGSNLGSADTTSPYAVSWDTTTASNGGHVLAARALDKLGNSATSSNVNITVSQAGPPAPPPAGDDVTISDGSGSGQTNRAISISRAFVQGEIADFVQASVAGTSLLTQCDVKNRWPDGSLKFAVVSFVIPSIPANGSVVVSFENQTSGNNTGFLAQSDMLGAAYNFDGQIRLTGTASHSISARAILTAAGSCQDPGSDPDGGKFECTYWLKGPIVTAVILEDRTARSFDVNTDGGTGNPLHPIFEAWFYPQGGLVQMGYTMENSWASSTPSNSARDQVYSVVLTGGNTSPATVFTNPSFTQITRSRWHRSFCINGAGAGTAYSCGPTVQVNQNWAYLAGTKFTPHWDPNLKIAASKISNEVTSFASTNQTLGGNANGVGFYPGPNQGGMNATGAAEYHGPLTTWDIITLMSQDPTMLPVTLGNADLGNAIPYFYREADLNAGHGQTFDNSGISGNVQTEGRIVSINARTQVSLLDTTAQSCNNNYPADWINFGTGGQDAGVWGTGELDTSHWPNLAYAAYLMTGQYAYYEEQLMQSAYALAASPGSRACTQPTGNSALRMGSAGYWYIDQERGTDWMARENFLGAFIAVDGSPEKTYLEDKLRANIAVWEGVHQVANDVGSSYGTAWSYGNTTRIVNLSAAGTQLGAWTHGPAVGPNGYAANYPLCLGNTSSPCPTPQFSNSPQDGNSNFQNAYSAVIIGWINDLGYCPGNCAILGYVANHFINEALNPASNMYHLSDYVFPTLDANGNEITSWTEDQTFYVPGGQATSWPRCGQQNPDEWYTGEDMAALSYFYTMSSSQGGYSGATAYNTLRSAQDALGCVDNFPGADFPTASPKWDITPRATNPPPAP